MSKQFYEARIVFASGGVISSLDTKRVSQQHGRETRYETVLRYPPQSEGGVVCYDFDSVLFRVRVMSDGMLKVNFEQDMTGSYKRVYVGGVEVAEGVDLSHSMRYAPSPLVERLKRGVRPRRAAEPVMPPPVSVKGLTAGEVEAYRELLKRSGEDGCLVTVIMPAVARTRTTIKTATGIVRHADFPHLFKAIVHPKRRELIEWLEDKGIEVIQAHYFPIVKAKHEMVKMCETKYMLMMDNDLMPTTPMRPMLDFMEEHPDVGVCATALEGSPLHGVLHYGAVFKVSKSRLLAVRPKAKVMPFQYCNYVHHGATLWRMEVFKEIGYDLKYPGQGHEHEDIFLQLARTEWKVVSFNAVSVNPLWERGPDWYKKLRGRKIAASRRYFESKWNLKGKIRV